MRPSSPICSTRPTKRTGLAAAARLRATRSDPALRPKSTTPADTAALPRAADWRDEKAPLADRARAYLDINCAHCHQAQATASNTALRLDAFAPVGWQMGLCKPSVAAGKGTGDRLFGIVPGQPDASIMAFRMASAEGGVMMPELGRSTIHEDGLRLVRQWITALPGQCATR